MPIQNTGTILNWYRRFTSHGLRHGIFIPPFESLAPNTKMGLWSRQLNANIVARIGIMSQTIHVAIINAQAISAGPEFTRIMNTTC